MFSSLLSVMRRLFLRSRRAQEARIAASRARAEARRQRKASLAASQCEAEKAGCAPRMMTTLTGAKFGDSFEEHVELVGTDPSEDWSSATAYYKQSEPKIRGIGFLIDGWENGKFYERDHRTGETLAERNCKAR